MDIMTTILTGSIFFGLTAADNFETPNHYMLLSAPVHEILWADNGSKLTELHKIHPETLSVYFPMEKDIPYPSSFKILVDSLPEKAVVSVTGFASNDGADPAMRYNLALKRSDKIKAMLEKEGFSVRNTGGKVCNGADCARKCWRADVIFAKDE